MAVGSHSAASSVGTDCDPSGAPRREGRFSVDIRWSPWHFWPTAPSGSGRVGFDAITCFALQRRQDSNFNLSLLESVRLLALALSLWLYASPTRLPGLGRRDRRRGLKYDTKSSDPSEPGRALRASIGALARGQCGEIAVLGRRDRRRVGFVSRFDFNLIRHLQILPDAVGPLA